MIATVTLNPGIDYQVFFEKFRLNALNRYDSSRCLPGGKGLNVSLLLSSLGMETRALGAAAGFTGREIVRLMEEAGCPTDFVFLPEGCSRINIKLFVRGEDPSETELNGPGPAFSPEALEALEQKLDALRNGDGLVLAGSIPSSLPATFYARLLERVRGKDLLTVVDAAGEALLAALPYRPFLIKPNQKELGDLFDTEVADRETARELAFRLREMGARNVAVSLGSAGAMLVCEDGRTLLCHAPRDTAVSTVGAGDSLVAGFLYGWKLAGTPESALTWGVAAGSATAFTEGIASGEQVRALYPRVGNVHPF